MSRVVLTLLWISRALTLVLVLLVSGGVALEVAVATHGRERLSRFLHTPPGSTLSELVTRMEKPKSSSPLANGYTLVVFEGFDLATPQAVVTDRGRVAEVWLLVGGLRLRVDRLPGMKALDAVYVLLVLVLLALLWRGAKKDFLSPGFYVVAIFMGCSMTTMDGVLGLLTLCLLRNSAGRERRVVGAVFLAADAGGLVGYALLCHLVPAGLIEPLWLGIFLGAGIVGGGAIGMPWNMRPTTRMTPRAG